MMAAMGGNMKKICQLLNEMKPVLAMVAVQLSYAGINIFYKLAAIDGMSLRVIVAYRYIIATVIMIPLALIFERKNRPKLTWTILFQAFLCGFFGGSLFQNLYVETLALTSATFTSAMSNLIPAVTFFLAVSFGLEQMGIRTKEGKAKVMGTIMGIGGAMLLTFYKGAKIDIWSTHINLMKNVKPHAAVHEAESDGSRLLGSLYAVANCFSFSIWLIIQAKMSKRYPCPYSSTALMSTMAAIQSFLFTLCIEGDWSQWKLGWNVRLFTSVYAGIVVQGVMITLTIWCVSIKGPLFASIFYPLMLLFTAIAGSLLLDEKLHVGSIAGATLIVCGLYAVLWGKDREMKKMSQLIPLKNSVEAANNENGENCNKSMINENL